MSYNKPFAEPIITVSICQYGCNSVARFSFRNGKICCSKHYNSCPGKIKIFSELDHSERTAKSLETRTNLGITKSSQIRAGKTRRENGHYDRLAKKMQDHWAAHPWQNNIYCPLLSYKNTIVNYQGSFEYEFLEILEDKHDIDWIIKNVVRGPSIWYIDPTTNTERLYISDFLIENVVYEIKSSWTWNKRGKDFDLENKNKAKLAAIIKNGYDAILVLDGREINATTLD
jgi:hypothetical protein